MQENAAVTPMNLSSFFDEIRRTIVALPEALEKIKKEYEALDQISKLPWSDENGEVNQELFHLIKERLYRESKAQQGILSERQYWDHRKRLEEAVLEESQGNLSFKNLFGLGDKGYAENRNYDFAPLLYLHLGLSGGAFAITDQVRNGIRIQHNEALQKEEIFNDGQNPFIDIPYRSANLFQNPAIIKKMLDAMYISVRQSQRLIDLTEYSPEFYLYMPHLLKEDKKARLLPYEQEMVKNNFQFIYCGVGEVLFHLFAWRMLVHQAQYKGIDHLVELDTFRAFDIKNKDFWKEVKNKADKDTNFNLPEADWIEYLHKKSNQPKQSGQQQEASLQEVWQKCFLEKVNAIQEGGNEEDTFTMWEEYKLLGLIKRENTQNPWYFTRDFLEMIRYALHIIDKYLRWEVDREEINIDTEETAIKQKILSSLQMLESRLDNYYQENREKQNPDSPFFPSYDNLKPYLYPLTEANDHKEGKRINDCLLRVAKEYLMEGKKKAVLSVLLRQLHKNCRFPIIPYYYELATSENHQPKEHLVFRIWDSQDNKITLANMDDSQNKTREDSGVAFVLLTLNPIWTIRPDFNLMKNGNGIHYAKELSDEAFNRIFRLYDFFSFLARPIIDQVFYGSIIKQAHAKITLEHDISSFNHELGKVTDNIFDKSNISIEKLFGEKAGEMATLISESIAGDKKPEVEAVKSWKVIPDVERFEDWQNLLLLWAGKERSLLLDESKLPKRGVEDLFHFCQQHARGMYAGRQYNAAAPETYADVVLHKFHVDKDKEKLPNIHSIDYHDKEQFPGLTLIKASKSEEIFAQNAFFRLLLAIFKNTLEHIPEGGHIHVLLRYQEDGVTLEGYVLNLRKDKAKAVIKSKGTKAVMDSCLAMANGKVLNFGPLVDYIHHRNSVLSQWIDQLEVADRDGLWLTGFRIPIQHIFHVSCPENGK